MADMATLVYEIDSSAARSAAKDLLALEAASGEMASGMSKAGAVFNKSTGQWEQTMRRTNGQFKTARESVFDYGDEIRGLAGKYNPAMSAALQYARAQEEVSRAVALGVLSEGQKAVALQKVSVQLAAAATAQARFGDAAQVASHHATNLGYQINDIGMMMSLGQNPFALMMQQGPQVAQIFSQMNAEGRKIGPTLAGAFTSILNPTTAITLALIGGTAALVQWGMGALGAGTNTLSFKDSVTEAQAAIDELNRVTKLYSSDGLVELERKYGEVNFAILALLENQRLLALADATEKLRTSLSAITSELGSGIFSTAYGELESAFEVSANEAQVLYGIIERIGSLDTIEKQIASIGRLKARLSDATDGFTDMNSEQLKMLRLLTQAEDNARQLAAAAPKGDWMNAAIDGVGRLGAAIRARIGEAMRLAAIANGPGMTTGNADWAKGPVGFTIPGNELLPPVAESSGGGVGSAGGGGASVADEMQKRWEALNQGFQAELTLKTEQYNKDLVALKWALDQKIISEQQYQTNKNALQVEAFGLDYERNLAQYSLENAALQTAFDQKLLTEQQYLMRRRELQHQYYSESIGVDQSAASQQLSQMAADFGQMNSLAGGGYDSLLRAQKAFAAGSALINAYLAASQAMADPTVPYWMKIAAYAKVLAAGMGAVNAIKGGGGKGGSAASSSVAATKQEPTKNILVNLTGPAFMVDMAEEIMTQIYSASKDGRVIIARDVT